MKSIASEYERAEAVQKQMPLSRFWTNAAKRHREWHILGAVQKLLIAAGRHVPSFADDQESPDFITYAADQSLWAPVEIVEIVRPGQKRHAAYRERELRGTRCWPLHHDPLDHPWEPLRAEILKKSRKHYGLSVCLMAYFDIGRFSFADMNNPFDEQLLAEHTHSPFLGIECFSRILVMSSDMGALVQLGPIPLPIVPDRPNHHRHFLFPPVRE
jgi:hypothetical protein